MITKRAHRARPSRGFDLESRHPQRAWLAGCAGKPRYTSEAAALAAIGVLLSRAPLTAYRCAHCDGWHHAEALRTGQRKAPPPVYLLAFVCGRCHARSADFAASTEEWTPARRRVALLSLEPLAMRAGWSIGVEADHCPTCAAALGLATGGDV